VHLSLTCLSAPLSVSGYKLINVNGTAVEASAARLNISSSVAQPLIRTFAVYAPCPSS
jgi:hypothetical protein